MGGIRRCKLQLKIPFSIEEPGIRVATGDVIQSSSCQIASCCDRIGEGLTTIRCSVFTGLKRQLSWGVARVVTLAHGASKLIAGEGKLRRFS